MKARTIGALALSVLAFAAEPALATRRTPNQVELSKAIGVTYFSPNSCMAFDSDGSVTETLCGWTVVDPDGV